MQYLAKPLPRTTSRPRKSETPWLWWAPIPSNSAEVGGVSLVFQDLGFEPMEVLATMFSVLSASESVSLGVPKLIDIEF